MSNIVDIAFCGIYHKNITVKKFELFKNSMSPNSVSKKETKIAFIIITLHSVSR